MQMQMQTPNSEVSPWETLLGRLLDYQQLPQPGAPLNEFDRSAGFKQFRPTPEHPGGKRLWLPSETVPEGWQTLLFSSGRGCGKALDVATPILTANRGWVTVGDVVRGDLLFDERGIPTSVLAVYAPTPERVFDVSFSTGEVVRACGDHLWTVMDCQDAVPRDWAVNPHVQTCTISTARMFSSDSEFFIPNVSKHFSSIDNWMVTSVVEVDERPEMRCFTVDSPSHLFCVTKSMIPTHNTFSGSAWALLSCAFYALTAKPETTVNVFVIGPSWAHVIETMMFEGDSSIMGVAPEGLINVKACSRNTATGRPTITLHTEGRPGKVTITGLSAETPEKWRGKEGQGAWWDEPAACQYAMSCWQQLRQILRKSEFPKALLTTTPDRLAPSKELVWALDGAARGEPDSPVVLAELGGLVGPVVRRTVPSWANTTMPEEWRESQRAAAESGSAWARQEILGELVDGVVEALIGLEDILWVPMPPPEGVRWVDIGVDPAMTSGRGDEFGLVAMAATKPKVVGHNCQGVLIEDRSGHMDANSAWERLGQMVRRHPVRKVFVEHNQGGDFVLDGARTAVQEAGCDPRIVQAAWSSKGKTFRAQPVAVAFRDKRLGVVEGLRGQEMMKQWLTWQPEIDKKVSPDRIDASVAATFGMDFGKPVKKSTLRRAERPNVDYRRRRR